MAVVLVVLTSTGTSNRMAVPQAGLYYLNLGTRTQPGTSTHTRAGARTVTQY